MITPAAVPSPIGLGGVRVRHPRDGGAVRRPCGRPSRPKLVLIFVDLLRGDVGDVDVAAVVAEHAWSAAPKTSCLPSGDHDGAPLTV